MTSSPRLSDLAPGRRQLPAPVVLATAFGAAAVPVDQLAARLVAGTDLRRHRGGTVSGSALFEVAGFPTLAVAGCLDLAQGALGPLLAGRHRPYLTAASVWPPWWPTTGRRCCAALADAASPRRLAPWP